MKIRPMKIMAHLRLRSREIRSRRVHPEPTKLANKAKSIQNPATPRNAMTETARSESPVLRKHLLRDIRRLLQFADHSLFLFAVMTFFATESALSVFVFTAPLFTSTGNQLIWVKEWAEVREGRNGKRDVLFFNRFFLVGGGFSLQILSFVFA